MARALASHTGGLRPPVAGRHRELQHLVDGPRINPKPPRDRPLAQPLNPNRMSYLRVEAPRPSSLAPRPNQAKCFLAAGFLLRGATLNHSGRFTEGFLLRCLDIGKPSVIMTWVSASMSWYLRLPHGAANGLKLTTRAPAIRREAAGGDEHASARDHQVSWTSTCITLTVPFL